VALQLIDFWFRSETDMFFLLFLYLLFVYYSLLRDAALQIRPVSRNLPNTYYLIDLWERYVILHHFLPMTT
jgi:hypothetical protein